jgi:rhodanese-related sulfurtransferase
MPIAHASVTDAHHAQQQGATYIDVRSTAEYAESHPAGAINVPLLEHDEDTGQLMPNPDFVRVMKTNFAPDAALLIGCRSGARSARASQILETFGFTNLTNVLAGFDAWAPTGLPTDTSTPAGRSYADLLTVADAADA